jgi:hypothetical protein
MSTLPTVPNSLPLTDEQAKAITASANLGTTVVTEGSNLARYMGRVLGTAPQDAVGLVIGDPLHFVRSVIAGQYDVLLDKIFSKRNVKETQPVSPSVAIPLLRAAYDENRPELQELWAALMASAMDPQRAGRVRLSFIETLKHFDPLDALVLKTRHDHPGDIRPNSIAGVANLIKERETEVHISFDQLQVLKCAACVHQPTNFIITNYGNSLIEVCSP